MRQRTLLIALVLLIPAAFLAGRIGGRSTRSAADRKVLYYVDPMNPSFRSPVPGIAPCGMPFEPVFADGQAPRGGVATPSGAVSVRADRLQLIGVSQEKVTRRSLRHVIRLVGTVAPDEARLFRITAATSGRIREMGKATTGSLVASGEILGAYYTPDASVPQQNYIRVLLAYQELLKIGSNPRDNLQGGGQLAAYEKNLNATRQTLLNIGMSPEQIEEIGRNATPAPLIQIRAPAAGFITSRNTSLGQSFETGDELYTIADLGRVWVLADAFEGQERFFAPGAPATVLVTGAGRTIRAEVSDVLPRFDPSTRTLKVRLEAPNPAFLMRPGMFVDVELPVESGPGIFLAKEAVLDSGTRKIVFVEQEPGVFLPRAVRTGRRLGEMVEIVAGLMDGETVVTSGNFLLDSESRMRAAGASAARGTVIDPICGMEVEKGTARRRRMISEHGGRTWFFCTPECKREFDADPAAAVEKAIDSSMADPPSDPEAPVAESRLKSEAVPAPAGDGGQGEAHEEMRDRGSAETSPGARIEDASFKRDWAAQGQRMPDPADPVCGLAVSEPRSITEKLFSEHNGKLWFFCSPQCKKVFDSDPSVYSQTSR